MLLLQISELFAANEIIHHAAARGVRAKAVGFNSWMIEKSVRVAAIPNAGRLVTPDAGTPGSGPGTLLTGSALDKWNTAVSATPAAPRYAVERARIPEYMASFNRPGSEHILDYENWHTLHVSHGSGPDSSHALVRVAVDQDYPLWVPLHRTFYRGDSMNIRAEASMENHYELYIDDMSW